MASDRDWDLCWETVNKLVDEAGKLIAARNSGSKTVAEKTDDIDLVTETDQQVEKLLVDGLHEKFPSHKFIGEEAFGEGRKSLLTDDPTWIIDPVDGTMNFVHSYPQSCVSIALWVNKSAELAVVYNPVFSQKFTARRGQGAYFNGQKITVSGQKALNKALITTEFGTSRETDKVRVTLENLAKVVPAVHGIRVTGSAALNMCMVAQGAADLNWEYGPHAWDMAAGDLIVREAGGVTMDPAGGPLDIMSRRVLAASSRELAEDFIKLLTQFYPQPRDD
ncbi:inositol monophosphatase 1-like [Phlebotomus argentipes]|uniref:inositol monophosphatase 1-like n=1 Tax=Phlebotomus argentipes TaxID=94469 RepID=UPI002892AD05|nr:inositol monophosphatase 1-like [Phlebotomus argentipes]